MKKVCTIIFILLLAVSPYIQVFAQENIEEPEMPSFEEDDSFGFGSNGSTNEKALSVTIGGKFSTGAGLFLDEFKDFKSLRPTSLIWGELFLQANAPVCEAFIKLKLNDSTLPVKLKKKPVISPEPLIPAWIDQAYVQAVTGGFVFGGGIKKVYWGRAETLSILDVVNPMDLTDGTLLKTEERKIAQPMFFFSAYMPRETKLEAVFLPMFQPDRIAVTGRWRSALTEKSAAVYGAGNAEKTAELLKKDSAKLQYAHGGVRFTASVAGLHDIGFQYFYGYLFTPALDLRKKSISYTPYHNIGMDYATALGAFNLHIELAANLTHDINGTREDMYNPRLAWNTGFDYTMPRGFGLGITLAENIKLAKKARTNPLDTESEENITDTVLALFVSQRFMRGGAEWKLTSFVGLENADFLISPGINFLLGSIDLDLNMGFFGGKYRKGKFGTYTGNHYMKLSMGYQF